MKKTLFALLLAVLIAACTVISCSQNVVNNTLETVPTNDWNKFCYLYDVFGKASSEDFTSNSVMMSYVVKDVPWGFNYFTSDTNDGKYVGVTGLINGTIVDIDADIAKAEFSLTSIKGYKTPTDTYPDITKAEFMISKTDLLSDKESCVFDVKAITPNTSATNWTVDDVVIEKDFHRALRKILYRTNTYMTGKLEIVYTLNDTLTSFILADLLSLDCYGEIEEGAKMTVTFDNGTLAKKVDFGFCNATITINANVGGKDYEATLDTAKNTIVINKTTFAAREFDFSSI